MVNHHLSNWLKLRHELDDCDLESALIQVAEYWNNPPFTPYYLDPSAAHEWPDPWTLVQDNVFCDIAKALTMLYTIYFSKHREAIDLELRIYKCQKTGYEYNVVWINDGKYILNCDAGLISKELLPEEFRLIKSYTLTELQVDKY